MVEVDVTRDAEGLLDRLADLHSSNPDLVDDLLLALGCALRFRDASRAEGDDARATLAASQADAARDELVAYMAADNPPPVTAELSRQEAVELAAELHNAAGVIRQMRGAA
ncbi:hypothetical protein [Streptomyces sp. Isolate_219]|uniref:hypothetical protein n=1 Tax=Streptomyces sp. Isolate_219 TaxID=2950110 RepID=UPI0021C807C9|nr:hypothetical protein [Streptomyces sp. Isolate_219]MCR8574735.1 hypothetical protein [Streptomyces sp. Isolate_219]